jgi:hypothetical protein
MSEMTSGLPWTDSEIREAVRSAKLVADKVCGIAWDRLEEISRVELILAALAGTISRAPLPAPPAKDTI